METSNLNTIACNNAITQLNELQFHDAIECSQKNLINQTAENGDKRSERSLSESSDSLSFNTSDDDSSREDDFYTKLQVVKKPLIINVKKAIKFRDNPAKHTEVYPMRSNPRGLVLIIANNLYKVINTKRDGAKCDESNLTQLFEQMGFKVITRPNRTGEQIDDIINEFSQMDELRKADSAFIIISSHGDGKVGLQETEIHGVDYKSDKYKKVVCTKLVNYFTASNCKNLRGKPKIFIFQACRGNQCQPAVSRHKTDIATVSRPRIEKPYIHFSDTLRDHEDILIVYATMPGYVSYRDKYNGSWFIQILCEVFMNHAHKFHVQDLFSIIDYRLKYMRTPEGNCQTPSIIVHGFKKCFLNPGLFEIEQINKNNKSNLKEKVDVMFKCCPDRRANICICSQCESIYHYKCAKRLDQIQFIGKSKVDCCCLSNGRSGSEESENKSLRENVEELKKVLRNLKEENYHLKKQVSTLQTQHIQIMSNEIDFKNSEETMEKENLIKENDLLKRLIDEMSGNNELLKEKNEMLNKKLNKKSLCLKQRFKKIVERKRNRPLNTVEPEEI